MNLSQINSANKADLLAFVAPLEPDANEQMTRKELQELARRHVPAGPLESGVDEVENNTYVEKEQGFSDWELGDLLEELHKKGFRTKAELVAHLEAQVREKKTYDHRMKEIQVSEDELEQKEIKFTKRQADAEKEFLRLSSLKEEVRTMTENFQKLRDDYSKNPLPPK